MWKGPVAKLYRESGSQNGIERVREGPVATLYRESGSQNGIGRVPESVQAKTQSWSGLYSTDREVACMHVFTKERALVHVHMHERLSWKSPERSSCQAL